MIPIILILFIANCEAEERHVFHTSRIKSEVVEYTYPLSKIKDLPVWDMRSEAPLTFKDAVSKAWRYVEGKHSKVDLFLADMELELINCPEEYLKEGDFCWVYRFKFMDLKTWKRLPGVIIILMDGQILEPTLKVKDDL